MAKNAYLCQLMEQAEQIVVLGSTGSIGSQALEVMEHFPHKFHPHTLIAGQNVEKLIRQAKKYHPCKAIIYDKSKLSFLESELKADGVICGSGLDDICAAVTDAEAGMLLSATVGYSGLVPTLKAIEAGKDIALANKETLVVAGELVTSLAKEKGVKIFPVDSEHSAVFQCLVGEDSSAVDALILTASGGPFLNTPKEKLEHVTAAEALKHPNWSMGSKITIDSATMMNKAFEIIEAHWLFNLPADKIEVVIHPQSIIHSMVRFVDGAVKAQMGVPDMRIPIMYAMNRAKRLKNPFPELHLELPRQEELKFEVPDTAKFPCLKFADIALTEKGNVACVINAANEVAVDAFLKGIISFNDIFYTVMKTLDCSRRITSPSLEEYVESNGEARRTALEIVNKLN